MTKRKSGLIRFIATYEDGSTHYLEIDARCNSRCAMRPSGLSSFRIFQTETLPQRDTRPMPRKPAKQRNPIRGATPARDYEIGDGVFLSYAGSAGEGLFIGLLREDATYLALALSEGQIIETPGCRLFSNGTHRAEALDQSAASEGDFQNKVDFAFGHLDQIFPIRKSWLNSNYITRFNNVVQSSDAAFREGGFSLRCVSEYFVRSHHFAIHRHAAMNDDRASMILDDVRHGVPPRHTTDLAAHFSATSKERGRCVALSGRERNAMATTTCFPATAIGLTVSVGSGINAGY